MTYEWENGLHENKNLLGVEDIYQFIAAWIDLIVMYYINHYKCGFI